MAAAHAVSVDEYLNTSYRPDCDYLEGELLKRNVGEWDHARLQGLLSGYLSNREKELGILVVLASAYRSKPNISAYPISRFWPARGLLAGSSPIRLSCASKSCPPAIESWKCRIESATTSISACAMSGLSLPHAKRPAPG